MATSATAAPIGESGEWGTDMPTHPVDELVAQMVEMELSRRDLLRLLERQAGRSSEAARNIATACSYRLAQLRGQGGDGT